MRAHHLATIAALLLMMPQSALAEAAPSPDAARVLAAERQAFELVNRYRKMMAVRPLRWHPLMSMNAEAHAHYVEKNPGSFGHYEEKDRPGHSRRGEAGAMGLICYTGDPLKGVHALINSVYHRLPLIDPTGTDCGIGYSSKATVVDVLKELPYSQSYIPRFNDTRLSLYPIPDQTGLPTTFSGETPDPIPKEDQDRKTGSPITVTWPHLADCRKKSDFTTLSLTLTDPAGHEVPSYVVLPDDHAPMTVSVLAKDPLKTGTAYRIAVNLQPKNGPKLALTWSFRTRTGSEQPDGGPYRFWYKSKPNPSQAEAQRYWYLLPENVPKAFAGPLKILHLGACRLQVASEAIGSLSNLQELALPYNKLQALPPALGKLSKLWYLDVSCNQLKSVPAEVAALPALTRIWLVDNQLTSLPETVAKATSLEDVDASYNRLTSVPQGLFGLPLLHSLKLAHNAVASLPPFGTNLHDFKELLVGSNQLTALPETINRLTELQKLDASHNQLGQLPEGLGQLPSLKELYLRDNRLRSLPETIGGLPKLSVLDLAFNQLERVPATVANLSELTTLDLSYNRLSALPTGLEHLSQLNTLILIGNPLPPAAVQALREQLPKVAILF